MTFVLVLAIRPPRLVMICNGAIAGQMVLALSALFVWATLPPDESAYGGRDCPDLGGVGGDAFGVIAYSSLAVGAVAPASAVLSVHARAARPGRIVAGLAASGLSYPIWFALFVAAFCSLS
jgi:hypothetical protein